MRVSASTVARRTSGDACVRPSATRSLRAPGMRASAATAASRCFESALSSTTASIASAQLPAGWAASVTSPSRAALATSALASPPAVQRSTLTLSAPPRRENAWIAASRRAGSSDRSACCSVGATVWPARRPSAPSAATAMSRSAAPA